MKINYDGRKFRSVANSAGGEVGFDTIFNFHQQEHIVTAEYSGGEIAYGHLTAVCDADGRLDMAYHHVNRAGVLMAGVCDSIPEILADGRVRLHDKWRWTHGGEGSGESTIEEI